MQVWDWIIAFLTDQSFRSEVSSTGGFILTLVGFPITVISLILAYVFYKRSLRVKAPCWDIVNNNLVSESVSKLDGLEVLYGRVPVARLSVARVIFWNGGSETILESDI